MWELDSAVVSIQEMEKIIIYIHWTRISWELKGCLGMRLHIFLITSSKTHLLCRCVYSKIFALWTCWVGGAMQPPQLSRPPVHLSSSGIPPAEWMEQCSLLNCPAHQYICHPHHSILLIGFLKGVLHEIFDCRFFFHKTVSPWPLSMPLGSFRFFLKICGDNREWMLFSGVNDTSDKREIFSGIIFFHFLCRAWLTVLYT